MRKIGYLLCLLFFSFNRILAQTTADYAVQVSCTVSKNPAEIRLHWKPSTITVTSYEVYRKLKTESVWNNAIATLPATATSWTDKNVTTGTIYEYQVIRIADTWKGYGYMTAAIEAPVFESRGKVLLLVDESLAAGLAPQIQRLVLDLMGDGWQVIRRNVQRTAKVAQVKTLILTEYNRNKSDLKSVFLLGHVAVPYSGSFATDGHPDHNGAWPADCYYGDMDGTWKDQFVNLTSPARTENRNVPGDGKYDDDIIPSAIELQVGRVDLWGMPAFKISESALLKRYLDRNHLFRTGNLAIRQRGLIDDQFGALNGEAFAASAFKAFAPMFGDSNIIEGSYFPKLRKENFLWSYACAGGNYTTATNVGNTDSFATDSVQTIFTMLFGSYFGDFDVTDGFLRAPLAAKGGALASVWSGRPHFIFHQMALGENIGYCTRISQMDTLTYFRHLVQTFGATRQSNLMGDPTLRMHPVSMPSQLKAIGSDDSMNRRSSVSLRWNRAAGSNLGYYVYRTANLNAGFTRITQSPVTDSAFMDSLPTIGKNYYMVRTLTLQQSGSGSYFNLSTGLIDSATVLFSAITDLPGSLPNLSLYPNPASQKLHLYADGLKAKGTVQVQDLAGRILNQESIYPGQTLEVNVAKLPQGIYVLSLKNEQGVITEKFVKR